MSSARLTAAFVIGCAMTSPAQAQQYVAPFNEVVVVLDASISFQLPVADAGATGRIPAVEALRVVQKLFSDSNAQKRRRNASEDQYVIVAADAASQVIWRGNQSSLASLSPDALLAMLKVRREFAHCTDYQAALNAAAKTLQEDADATNRYVLTFGDLIHEPPTTSYRTCAAPSGKPPDGIEWDTLRTAALGFYFVSTDFKLRPNQQWLALLDSRGIKANLKDMAQTMTQAVELPPPPPAIYRPTAEQTAAAEQSWDHLKNVAWTALKTVLGGVGLLVAALVGLAARARRRATARQVRQRGRNG